jgi:hypothetical protein
MANDVWYDFFIESLSKKYPKKSQLVDVLMDLLCLEREAVYRRLRKEVIFTVHEVVKITSEWDISLDELIGSQDGAISFMMKSINYYDPSEEELKEVQRRVKRIEHLKTSPNSECMEVCNRLPRSFTTKYPILFRFDNFRWAYQYGTNIAEIKGNPLFSQIVVSKKLYQEMHDYQEFIQHVGSMSYIWDHMMFDHFIRDITYFHSILLITDKEKDLLKQKTLELLDYLMEVANYGYIPETQKKVNIYISKIHIDTNYSYFYTDELKICRVYAFDKYDLFSYDTKMIENFRTWMQMKKRTSIQISEVDEKSRIEFFAKQRKLLEQL